MTLRPVKIVIVDRNDVTRKGVEAMIGDAGAPYQVVATFARLREADDYLGQSLVDLLILDDMTLHTIEVVRAVSRYHELYPGLSLIVLSQRRDGEYLQQVMRFGSAGYVLKNGDLQGPLLMALRMAGEKYPFLSPEAAKLIGSRREGKLDHRELEVLRLMERELSVKEIGEKLNLSVKTIYRIRDKLKRTLGCAIMKAWSTPPASTACLTAKSDRTSLCFQLKKLPACVKIPAAPVQFSRRPCLFFSPTSRFLCVRLEYPMPGPMRGRTWAFASSSPTKPTWCWSACRRF